MSSFKRMAKEKSIIQSTLIKVSIIIFIIFLIAYFYFAKNYWEKQLFEDKCELLSVISELQNKLQANYVEIKEYKQEEVPIDKKLSRISAVLKPSINSLSQNHPEVSIGYYDAELGKTIISTNELNSRISDSSQYFKCYETGAVEFFTDESIVNWDGRGVMAVTAPVYYSNKIVGHIWANYVPNDNFLYSIIGNGQSTNGYGLFLVICLILWLWLLIYLRKNMEYIKKELEIFSYSITSNSSDYGPLITEKLPELKPVLHKIQSYTSELKNLNNELQKSRDNLIAIMEGITDIFYSLDDDWRFIFINSQGKKCFNKEHSELIGEKIWEVMPEIAETTSYYYYKEAMMTKEPLEWTEESVYAQGKYLKFNVYPFSQGMSVFIKDITEDMKREKGLQRLERLNLIGQMAAGVSHEVRNPLTTVRGFLQMMQARSDSEENQEFMELMIAEIDRANDILTDFLSLARVSSENRKEVNLNDIIAKVFPMVQADAFNNRKDITLDLHDVPDVLVNDQEVKQLILNLVRNGLEATPEEGQVSIRTRLENQKVILEIEDQGKGLPLEILENFGAPFLTTKDYGTGLGLPISIRIAETNNAELNYATGKDGTTFYISFPVISN